MSGLSVKFNGVELNQYIDVLLGFTPFSGPEWSPELLSSGGIKRGTDFSYTTYKQKTIPMPFTVLENLKEKMDALNGVLNVDEPKELIFGNTPERVFYAIPSGDLDFDDYECFGEGTITWLVPDGLAHSTVEKSFPASANSDGVLGAIVVNNGTESVPISYEITHNHENGFFGIVSEHGVLELGDITELDGEKVSKSEYLMNYQNYTAYTAMTAGSGIFYDSTYGKGSSFKSYTYEGKTWLDIDSAGTGSGWHGAAKTITVPADSNGAVGAVNFALQGKVWFRPTNINQLGIIEYCVADETGAHLMSVRIAKWEPNRETAYLILCIGGKEKKRIEFNPFYSQLMVHDSGEFYMTKSGSKFTFNFGGLYTYDVPSLASKKGTTVSVFIGARDSYALVERMRLQYLVFRKDNVTKWKDIPNRYRSGSRIYIDGESTKVYLDGNERADDVVKGSKFFRAPPGETKVQFYVSDFCSTLPTVTAKIREAYL